MDNKEIEEQKQVRRNDDATQEQPQYGVRKEASAHALSRFSPPYNLSSEKTRTIAGAAAVTPIIEDEGVPLTVRAIINLIGSGVSAVDNPTTGATDVTITGAASFATPSIALGTAAAAGAAATVIRSDSTIEAFDATAPTTAAFSDAATTGSSGHAARRDHRHGMPASPAPTFGTPAVVLGTAAAAGVIDEVVRRDSTIVAFDATVPTTEAFGDAAATGSVAVASRRDHKHAMPANPVSYATPSVALGTAAAAGAAATLIRSDSTIAAFDATVPTTEAFGDAAATGSVAFASRRDHKHGMPANPVSFATPSVTLGTAAAAGAAATVIRSDATIVAFDATVPVTQAFGDAAATGSAAFAAHRDHVHGMPATPTSGMTAVPIEVTAGSTYTIVANTQVLYAAEITNNGTITNNGDFIMLRSA